jgi:uncharacterized protein YutE (UPF0331/DUF86 family)
MPDRDIILEKVANIQYCLKRIREVTKLDPDNLENITIQESFILNLQRAVQSAIDLAAHIVSSIGLGLPKVLRENFQFLYQNSLIDNELGQRLENMVGFRNIAIHDYSRINVDYLKSILINNLKDLEDFYTVIVKKYVNEN